MAEKPGLDPRYDPAFQRGFDPGAGADAQRPTVAFGPPLVPRVSSSASGRGPSAPAPAAPSQATAASGAPAASEAVAATAVIAVGRAPWRNPFIVALAVIGVASIALGVFVLQYAMREGEGGQLLFTQGGYVLMQSLVFAAPLAICTGVLILSAVLVMFAVHWGRLPHRDE
ncbi:hypothetical protein [Salinibacterium sp. ZJ70]|uniref:hypothetical protein n=1 Tax=Salinibacterium sp. ZJ70 TaxID=2708084 RepID=UPI0014249A56|nr:hypothetical protein [Salinibacterium sp. ZJ70]